MADVVLLTPRETVTGLSALNNQNVVVNDEEYARLDPAMRLFYDKVRENLGLACITAHLRASGFSVGALNLHGRNPDDRVIEELLIREQPALVGVSIMYDLHVNDAVRLIECARRAAPRALIAVGGAFCTYNAKLLAESLPPVDMVAFGEGELTLRRVMEAVRVGDDWRRVPGLVVRDLLGVHVTGMPELPDLRTAPWPARDVLRAHRTAGIPTPVASTYTSRGCHAKCTFCYAPRQPGVVDGPWRVRPALDVVDEIEALQAEFGTRFVWFNDDNFGGAFVDGFDHAVEFAEEILRRRIDIRFHCEFRVDSGLIDVEALALLKRAGMGSALLGLESGSPGMLRRFKKGVTVDFNFAGASMFLSQGLELDPGWIMIEPHTTLEELWENFEFMVSTGIHRTDNPFFLVNRAIALRGTEMFHQIEEPLPSTDVPDAGPARTILMEARRDYLVDDERVEALWSAWSSVGGEVSDRRENELPFVASAISREAREGDRARARRRLTQLRSWRNGLADLLVVFLNHGLNLADARVEDLQQRLTDDLRALVDDYDRRHLGAPFPEFAAAGPATAPAGSGAAR